MKQLYAVLMLLASVSLATISSGNDNPSALSTTAFVDIPAGCFEMGNPKALQQTTAFQLIQFGLTEPVNADEAPVHQVCLSDFSIANTEVTQAQWHQLMGGMATDPTLPAQNINWQQTQTYLEQLNRSSTTFHYRLPTEAEWEYACLAAITEEDSSSTEDVADEYRAWFASDADALDDPAPVAKKKPNALGLYDMQGNVWEWTQDSYRQESYQQHRYKDPIDNSPEPFKTIRGGSYRSGSNDIRCQNRGYYQSDDAMPSIGFRLLRVAR